MTDWRIAPQYFRYNDFEMETTPNNDGYVLTVKLGLKARRVFFDPAGRVTHVLNLNDPAGDQTALPANPLEVNMSKESELLKEVRRLRSVLRERDQFAEAAAASQTAAVQYRRALRTLVEACGHVNIGALNGTTVKDFRKVMTFMAAYDAAKELLGDEA